MFPQGFALPAPEGELEKKTCLFTKFLPRRFRGALAKTMFIHESVLPLRPKGGGEPHDQCFCRPGALPGSSPGIPGILPGISPEFPSVFPGSAGNNRGSRRHLIGTRGLWHFFLWILCLGATGTLKLNVFESLCPPCTRGELGKSCLFIGLLPRRFRSD